MSIFKYEQLILETAKALQCFIEQYKRDKAKNNIELNEDKIKLVAKIDDINKEITKKIDKEDGKGLSTNDFTTTLKEKLKRCEY